MRLSRLLAERLARVIGAKQVLFMKNYGVLVVGETVAQAYKRLYFLERVSRTQVLAMGTGRPPQVLSEAIVAQVQAPPRTTGIRAPSAIACSSRR